MTVRMDKQLKAMASSASSSLSLLSHLHCSKSRNCNKNPTSVLSGGEAPKLSSLTCFASKKKLGFMDQILDYIEGTVYNGITLLLLYVFQLLH